MTGGLITAMPGGLTTMTDGLITAMPGGLTTMTGGLITAMPGGLTTMTRGLIDDEFELNMLPRHCFSHFNTSDVRFMTASTNRGQPLARPTKVVRH